MTKQTSTTGAPLVSNVGAFTLITVYTDAGHAGVRTVVAPTDTRQNVERHTLACAHAIASRILQLAADDGVLENLGFPLVAFAGDWAASRESRWYTQASMVTFCATSYPKGEPAISEDDRAEIHERAVRCAMARM
jgi:hypothetical protein